MTAKSTSAHTRTLGFSSAADPLHREPVTRLTLYKTQSNREFLAESGVDVPKATDEGLKGVIIGDTRPPQGDLSEHQGAGPSMPSGTPSPALLLSIDDQLYVLMSGELQKITCYLLFNRFCFSRTSSNISPAVRDDHVNRAIQAHRNHCWPASQPGSAEHAHCKRLLWQLKLLVAEQGPSSNGMTDDSQHECENVGKAHQMRQ